MKMILDWDDSNSRGSEVNTLGVIGGTYGMSLKGRIAAWGGVHGEFPKQ